MDQYSKILATYRQKKSLRATAKSLDISNQTVRRVLITAGLYTSPRVERIRELSAAGMPPQYIRMDWACIHMDRARAAAETAIAEMTEAMQ